MCYGRMPGVRILFVDPQGTVPGINAGLGYLSSVLHKAGHSVRVLDFNNYPQRRDERLLSALNNNNDVIGFSVKSNTIDEAARLALMARAHSGGSIIIAGGAGVTAEGCNILKDYTCFDYAFRGEAEQNIVPFLSAIDRKATLNEISGICFRDNDGIVDSGILHATSMDLLPFPEYSFFDYMDMQFLNYPLVTSRGCPYRCSYCSVRFVSGSRFRCRSAENIAEELLQAKRKYNIEHFEVIDDTFTQDMERAKGICREFIRKDIGLTWKCPNGIRADKTDKELFRLMRDSGCREVWFGVESLNEEVFKLIDKGEQIEDIERAVLNAKRAGLKVGAFFIIGLPGSTYEKDLETLSRAKKLKLDFCTWSVATPMPQTVMSEWVGKNGKLLNDYRKVSFFVEPKCVFDTECYTETLRLRMFYKGNLSFFRYDTLSGLTDPWEKVMKILKLVLEYDPTRFLLHIFMGAKYFFWLLLKNNRFKY